MKKLLKYGIIKRLWEIIYGLYFILKEILKFIPIIIWILAQPPMIIALIILEIVLFPLFVVVWILCGRYYAGSIYRYIFYKTKILYFLRGYGFHCDDDDDDDDDDFVPLHVCQYCGVLTEEPDENCYKAPF